MPGSDLIQMEPGEAVDKLRLTLRVLGTFKNYYFEYRALSMQDTPENPWKFQNSSLFARLDSFLERCHDMMDLMSTCVQFNRLERVEIGGTKGKVLTNGVKAIHQDFTTAVEKFQQVCGAGAHSASSQLPLRSDIQGPQTCPHVRCCHAFECLRVFRLRPHATLTRCCAPAVRPCPTHRSPTT